MTASDVTTAVERVISEAEVLRVHGHANFGSMSPRQVFDDGVRKCAVGYHCGSTQLHILLDHGLITKPRPGRSDPGLSKKGKAYARDLYCRDKAELDRLSAALGEARDIIGTTPVVIVNGQAARLKGEGKLEEYVNKMAAWAPVAKAFVARIQQQEARDGRE